MRLMANFLTIRSDAGYRRPSKPLHCFSRDTSLWLTGAPIPTMPEFNRGPID